MNSSTFIISGIALRLPMLIIWVTGLYFAISRSNRHPKVSRLVVIALGIMILNEITSTLFVIFIPVIMIQKGLDNSQLNGYYLLNSVIHTLLYSAAWVMLIAAIFSGRGEDRQSRLAPLPSPLSNDLQNPFAESSPK